MMTGTGSVFVVVEVVVEVVVVEVLVELEVVIVEVVEVVEIVVDEVVILAVVDADLIMVMELSIRVVGVTESTSQLAAVPMAAIHAARDAPFGENRLMLNWKRLPTLSKKMAVTPLSRLPGMSLVAGVVAGSATPVSSNMHKVLNEPVVSGEFELVLCRAISWSPPTAKPITAVGLKKVNVGCVMLAVGNVALSRYVRTLPAGMICVALNPNQPSPGRKLALEATNPQSVK